MFETNIGAWKHSKDKWQVYYPHFHKIGRQRKIGSVSDFRTAYRMSRNFKGILLYKGKRASMFRIFFTKLFV
jgi:hypothetical protein